MGFPGGTPGSDTWQSRRTRGGPGWAWLSDAIFVDRLGDSCSKARCVLNKGIELLNRITIEPGKCGGRPCIRASRLRVGDVLELLAAGASHAEILADYSFLEPDDIRAALLYVARQADHAVLPAA